MESKTNLRELKGKFIHINRAHHKLAEKMLSKTGVHRNQHMLLMHLYHSTEAPSQKEIANRFNISPAAVAVSLKKLENEGYISRNANESDSRYNQITITEKGKSVVDMSKEILDGLDERSFGNLTDEEKETLATLLDKVIDNLKEGSI